MLRQQAQREPMVQLLRSLCSYTWAGGAGYKGVRYADHVGVLSRVVKRGQYPAEGCDPATLLVVASHDCPRRRWSVRAQEHGLLRLGVAVPPIQGSEVHRAEFPLPERVDDPDDETGPLFRPERPRTTI